GGAWSGRWGGGGGGGGWNQGDWKAGSTSGIWAPPTDSRISSRHPAAGSPASSRASARWQPASADTGSSTSPAASTARSPKLTAFEASPERVEAQQRAHSAQVRN